MARYKLFFILFFAFLLAVVFIEQGTSVRFAAAAAPHQDAQPAAPSTPAPPVPSGLRPRIYLPLVEVSSQEDIEALRWPRRTPTRWATSTPTKRPTSTPTKRYTATPTKPDTATPTKPFTATSTKRYTATATKTPIRPTATNTPFIPTATNTPFIPTATNTPFVPTATNTPFIPTATNTPFIPTPPAQVAPTATPIPPSGAAIYYVAPNGNDGNSGLDPSRPLLTIQKAVDLVRNPGETILVFPGEYRQAATINSGALVNIVGKHGQPGQEIVLKAYDPGNMPKLIGLSGIKIVASSYIRVEGFEITDITQSGFPIYLSDNITIKNNYLHLGYEGNCQANETGTYAGCTFYASRNLGEIKGRMDKNRKPIVESDGNQNTGVYMCKTINSKIIGNRFENFDESIYAGKAGNVGNYDCGYPNYNLARTWLEGNLIEGNLIENSWNEAVELKPDARFNIVRSNIIKSTRPMIETSLIDVRGHDNEVTENIIVGAPNVAIRVTSETVADPGEDRVEAYKKADGSYMSAFRNTIHHNYIFYWAQYTPNGIAIDLNSTGAANLAHHNTVVGSNEFSGAVSEFASIKTNAFPGTAVQDNLSVGIRRVDSTAGSQKYEYHLTSYNGTLPATSDYNAYFPRLKSNNASCTVALGSLSIVCQTNNATNANLGYEYHSQFMDANPINSDDGSCSKAELLALPIMELKNRVLFCGAPRQGATILGTASDGTNIGAYQGQVASNDTPPQLLVFIPGIWNSPTSIRDSLSGLLMPVVQEWLEPAP